MLTDQRQTPRYLQGLYAGVIASVVMGAVAMMLTALTGLGFLTPLRLIASVLLGGGAMAGAGAVVLGLAVHMMTGAGLGLAYAVLFGRSRAGLTTGALYGLGVWVLATLTLVPLMAAPMPHLTFALAHLAYGLTLAALLGR